MRQAAKWTVVIALLGSSTACVETQRQDLEASEKLYLLAADLFEKGHYRPALEELLKSLAANPKNAEAHYLRGLLALREAADSEAMIERQSCLRGEEARLERQLIDSKFQEAERSFLEAVTIRPDFSDAWNSLAVVDLHFAKWETAITHSGKALGNPVYRQPWVAQGNLGWAYHNKKDYLRAARELRQSLFANPQFCVGRYRLAKNHYEQGDYEAAEEELARVTADVKCPIQEAFLLHGVVALKRGDRPRAAALFQRCGELAPRSCLARECRIGE